MKLTPLICVHCGITSLDGAPDLGIEYPNVTERCDGELLCDACFTETEKESTASALMDHGGAPERPEINKICKCCSKVHTAIPSKARPWIEDGNLIGWFWECDCRSTLFKKSAGE